LDRRDLVLVSPSSTYLLIKLDTTITSFADRAKDTLKVSGAQVSPAEIEAVILSHPSGFISDATVAGVSGGRTDDEKIPRAWIALTASGKDKVSRMNEKGYNGKEEMMNIVKEWVKKSLSRIKWLRGGVEIVEEVRMPTNHLYELCCIHTYQIQIPKNTTGKVLRRVLQEQYEQSLQTQVKSKL
jgi:acyl-CoA synthetase (AMP-forming)/AMP-acid ligase II